MKALFVVGLLLLTLGVLSLVVPFPSTERKGVEVGGVNIGVKTTHDDKVPPIVSAVMILAGAGLLIAARR